MQQGGVSVDNKVISDIGAAFDGEAFAGDGLLVKRGKKSFVRVIR